MKLALRLAAKGRGRTSPNPMVGAVVVTAAGLIVGQGYHRRAGGRMTGLGRLERYVLGRTLTAVAAALAVIGSVIVLVQFVDLSRSVGVRADVSVAQIFALTLLKTPSLILVLLPFMFLFGGIAAFVGLNRRSELIAMRAAGVSAWRFILPAAGAAFVIGETEEIRFDIFYAAARARIRRVMCVVTALSLVILYAVSLPAVIDYVTFMKVEHTAYMKIRFDFLFSIYIVFTVAAIIRYLWLGCQAIWGKAPIAYDPTQAGSGV